MFLTVLLTLIAFVHPLVVTSQCAPSSFGDLSLFGAEILDISASPLADIAVSTIQGNNFVAHNLTGLAVCEVKIQYTHPGQNDTINVVVWLPLEDWNGRFVAVGGGGYSTGSGTSSLAIPVSLGYSAAFTDGGHTNSSLDADSWALVSPGNVNWVLLQDFAAIALNDFTTLGKSATKAFYGSMPKYSYWNGCSTGGRQGHMMAQRYPTQFDGILASAPAFNWHKFLVSEYWPQFIMNSIDVYPTQCELNAITEAATAACDALDGATDGVISAPGLCHFDPHEIIGQSFLCSTTGEQIQISEAAATIALATWNGPSTVDGKFEWFGLNQDAPLSGISNTNCSTGTCVGAPFEIASDWIRLFVVKDPDFNLLNLTHREYDIIFRQSVNQYGSVIGTDDPDLTDFRDAGGKMLTWHGLADNLIPPNGTYQYYERVLAGDPNAGDYYRFFPAPGVTHCRGGVGWYPGDVFQSLVDWVERGVVPDTLAAKSLPDANGTIREASLCAYPQQMVYKGGDINQASSFRCQ